MPRIVSAMSQGPWGGKGGSGGDGGESGGSGDDSSAGNGSGSGGSGGGGSGGGPRNPWTQPRGGGRPGDKRNPSAIDELLRRGRAGLGGGGFNLPQRPDGKPIWPLAVGILLIIWLALTCVHRIGPQERGVVLMLGKYSRTLSPGIGLTLPSPLESVETVDVEEIRTIDIGSAGEGSENLMLTGDQNIIDIAYQVRWSIRNPEQFLYELEEPEDTIRQVAESAMRQVISQISLQDAMGVGRGDIQARVQEEMQQTLDNYRSGINIRGVAIKQADPPAAVNEAFKEVTAAQQQAQSDINKANAYSLQLRQIAQGEATAFDKVYEQYRLAPGVTRRRMYYETMERILRNVDKTIVETPGVTPYLPLGEIRRSTPPGAR
jgi:membrane protease subunit HflK